MVIIKEYVIIVIKKIFFFWIRVNARNYFVLIFDTLFSPICVSNFYYISMTFITFFRTHFTLWIYYLIRINQRILAWRTLFTIIAYSINFLNFSWYAFSKLHCNYQRHLILIIFSLKLKGLSINLFYIFIIKS